MTAAGFCFFSKNSFLRLAFLLRVEGLLFFLVPGDKGTLPLVSREKEKMEPMETEKLKATPWLLSAWQKSKHLEAKLGSLSPTAVIFGVLLN